MGHGHAEFPVALPMRRGLAVVAGALAVLTVLGLVVLWPGGDVRRGVNDLGFTRDLYDAEVEAIASGPCTGSPVDDGSDVATCRTARVRLEQGPDRGERVELDLATDGAGPDIDRGDVLVLSYEPDAPEELRYAFADKNRKPVLWWLAALFAVVVVLLGRLRGIAALAGLVASFLVLLKFVIPAILLGSDPLAVAVIGAAAVAFVALYLAHGFGPMTSVALLGTLGSLAVTVVLAKVFVGLAELSGFASEEASFLNLATTRIDLAGLVLGGIVIGALGAIDDMTVTQASVVAELREASPDLSADASVRGGDARRPRPRCLDGEHAGPRLRRGVDAAPGPVRAERAVVGLDRQRRGDRHRGGPHARGEHRPGDGRPADDVAGRRRPR